MGMSERIDRVLDDLVKSGEAPGVAAMVVNDRGPLYQGAAGTKGVGRSEPMTLDTIFWYASMTKALVATGAMQLIEQGRLKLDEPASAILPQLASVQVLDGFDGGRRAQAQICQAANHAAPIAHPHGWLWIQLGERRHPSLS